MKNSTILTILFVLILSGCTCFEKLNYSELSQQELTTKKNDLKLSLNYIIVNSVISDIENGKNHMPLTKINKVISDKYLKNDSRLKETVNNWKFHSSKVGEFEKKHKPELQELGKLLKKDKISIDTYFKKNRQFRGELRNDFPSIYPKLSLNHINSLKTMWRKAGRLMIEDYKKEKKEFPTNWIPKEDIAKAKSLKNYKCTENTIKKIEQKNGI